MLLITRKFIISTFIIIFALVEVAQGQTHRVSGTVSSSSDNELLIGVTVQVANTSKGAATDVNGKYTISGLSPTDYLVFSYIGFKTVSLLVGEQTEIDVQMVPDEALLDELVVVGYGTQKKVTLTGSISSVSGEDLTQIPVSNISNMLIGNTPGVSGVQISGEPGRNATTINIRGVSTYGGSRPLIVIDGVQQPAEQGMNQFNNIDPNEIESLSVLKDASATAVYGIRGANGVIIVTTKRGKLGPPQISLSTNFGLSRATTMMRSVTSYEYAVMRNEAIRTENDAYENYSFNPYLFSDEDLWKFEHNRDYTPQDVAFMTHLTDEERNYLNNSPALYYGSRDWNKEVFGGLGPQSQLNFNISGGTEKIKYFASLGYFNQGSILNHTSYYESNTQSTFERYNFRTGYDIDIIKDLQISIDLAANFSTISGPGADRGSSLTERYESIMQWIYESNPFEVPGIIEGRLVNQYAGKSGGPSDPLGLKTGSSRGANSPLYRLLSSGNETVHRTFFSSDIYLKYDFTRIAEGLSASAKLNYEEGYTKSVKYHPSIPTFTARRNLLNPTEIIFFGGALSRDNFLVDPGNNSTWNRIYYEAALNYNRTFGNHNVGALVLGNAQRFTMPSDEYNTSSGLMGFVGRTTYNFKERYMAEFNMGYNGTEQFHEERRFGLFPALSAAWVISDESLFPKSMIVEYLKLRGSYGEVGNDQLRGRRYLYLPSTFSTGQNGYYFGSSDGSSPNPYYSGSTESTIGNPFITWERSIKTNIGIDTRHFNNKLSLNIDFFKEKRNNILTNLATVPSVYGVATSAAPPANVGKMNNHGYEIVAGWRSEIGELKYNILANINYARNKIVYRDEPPHLYYWMNETGFPLGQYKGLVHDGFFNTEEELFNRPYNMFTNNRATVGDVRYKDINGDGFIDEKDEVPIGFSNLPEYNYNLKVNLIYKNFDLSVLLIGTANGSYYLNYKMQIPFYKNAGNAYKWQYNNRWTPEKVATGQKITYPRAQVSGAPSDNNFLASDLWLISNNFKRIKNLELGYTFNEFPENLFISSVRFYVNANNLFTWGNEMKDLDPELQDTGSPYIYPMTQVFNVGARVQF